MKALIFAAGIGSRLKPWTDSHPKALVEVGGKPMLGRVIEKMINAGIRDIIVNVHHFADQIIDFLHASKFDADITVSDETSLLLETGGGLRKVVEQLGQEPVVIHNADILSDFDLSDMIKSHIESRADITLLTARRKTSRYFVFDETGRLCGWTNVVSGDVRPAGFVLTPPYQLKAFDGVHILSPNVYPLIKEFKEPQIPFSIVDFYLRYCRDVDIKSYNLPDGAFWFDIGKPETLEKARLYFVENIL